MRHAVAGSMTVGMEMRQSVDMKRLPSEQTRWFRCGGVFAKVSVCGEGRHLCVASLFKVRFSKTVTSGSTFCFP